MSRMKRALGCTIVSALVATSLVAGTPAAVRADGHPPTSVTLPMEPGSTGQAISPTVAEDDKQAEVETTFFTPADYVVKAIALSLLETPTPGRRLMKCLAIAGHAVNPETVEEDTAEARAEAPSKAVAAVELCLRLTAIISEVIAEELAASGGTTPRPAPAGCATVPMALTYRIQKVGGQYVATPASPVSIKPGNTRLKVGCTHTGGKVKLRIQPKKRRATLRSVIGKNLRVGVATPSTAGDSARVKVTFRGL